METVYFSVDVHLLAELGERLVGRPAIALGELVKNSYDADASVARVVFTKGNITVLDDGHGMTEDELHAGFLRIGTPRKEKQQLSPRLERRMTGSKGVGRLAAQMLGRSLILETRSVAAPKELLRLSINWDNKKEGQEITKFAAVLDRPTSPSLLGDTHGTAIQIGRLTRAWSSKDISELAQDIWMLRSPFPSDEDASASFTIEFKAEQETFEEAFEQILEGWVGLYEARLTGELHGPHRRQKGHDAEMAGVTHVHIDLELEDHPNGEGRRTRVTLPATSNALGHADYQIRIYKLQGRQPLGLSVGEVRDYLNDFGGVYLYDDGFRMPYYGPDTDWLGMEMDHAHRISRSKILPKDLQVAGGGTFLPTTSRVFGVVHVSTSHERELARMGKTEEGDSLQIQISRDRLLDTTAFDTLKAAVRAGLDLYAHEKARRKLRTAEEQLRATREQLKGSPDPLEVLKGIRRELPKDTYELIKEAVIVEREEGSARLDVESGRAAAMATLATAGMVSILIEHEHARLLPKLRAFVERYKADENRQVRELAYDVQEFVDQLEALSPMLRSVMEPEGREAARLSARRVVRRAVETLGLLLRGISVDVDVDQNVRLPKATLAEWTALFQNVILNAANAVMSVREPRIRVVARGGARSVRILDNGYGIDLDRADEFFEPFVRGDQKLPPERRALGMGGTGLGLTIVRTIAESAEANVGFEKPPKPWASSFVLSW